MEAHSERAREIGTSYGALVPVGAEKADNGSRFDLPLTFVIEEGEHNEATQTIISGIVAKYLKISAERFIWSKQRMGDFSLVAITPMYRGIDNLLRYIYIGESMRSYLLGRINLDAIKGWRLVSNSPMLPYAIQLMKDSAIGVDPILLEMPVKAFPPFLLVEDNSKYRYAWERIREMADTLGETSASPDPTSEEATSLGRYGLLIEADSGPERDLYMDLAEMWEGEILREDPLVVKGDKAWYRCSTDDVFLGKLPRYRVDARWCKEEVSNQATFVAVSAYMELLVEYPHLYPFIGDIEVRTGGISARFASLEEVRRYEVLLDPPDNLATISVISAPNLEDAIAMRWYFQKVLGTGAPNIRTMIVGNYNVVVNSSIDIPSSEDVSLARKEILEALERIPRYYPQEDVPEDMVRSVPLRVGSSWLGDWETSMYVFRDLGLRGYFNFGPLLGAIPSIPVPQVKVPGKIYIRGIIPQRPTLDASGFPNSILVFYAQVEEGGIDLFEVDLGYRLTNAKILDLLRKVEKLWSTGWFLSPWGIAHVARYSRLSRAGALRYLGDWRYAVGTSAEDLLDAFGR